MTTSGLFLEILIWLLCSFPIAFLVGFVFFPKKR